MLKLTLIPGHSPGTVFAKTEMSEVLTEIVKADPTFDKEKFLEDVHNEIIPNVLEVSIMILFEMFWFGCGQ